MSWLKRLTDGLKKSSASATSQLTGIFTGKKINADTMESLEEALISADLGVAASSKIVQELAKKYDGKSGDQDELLDALAVAISNILKPLQKQLLVLDTYHPHIMMLVGVNGSGKTTTAGKLARRFSQQGKKVVLVAADTFRAAAIEQLKGWAERSSVDILSAQRGADPAALVYQSIEKARQQKADLILIDTAGRLQNRTELMEELAKIVRVIKKLVPEAPHDSLIVLDGTVGQNSISQLKAFQDVSAITGLIMTKLDGSARGGALVALAEEFELPIHLIGVGETAEDLQDFNADAYARALLGLPLDE
ncbi:MAG: Signal recognition particle receptor FtsY [SAR116 cluster bacterium]|jgi:fused signal recognition particle receptor|nr:signal recognition particle-docking protein FtsY [Alphaproteobacteria bacterium]CAI8401236.1 MAG: Signal recognition particle receptor FtsY [SAR116 cluster bacterium]